MVGEAEEGAGGEVVEFDCDGGGVVDGAVGGDIATAEGVVERVGGRFGGCEEAGYGITFYWRNV